MVKERIFLHELSYLVNLAAAIFHGFGELVNVINITGAASFPLTFCYRHSESEFLFSFLESVVG